MIRAPIQARSVFEDSSKIELNSQKNDAPLLIYQAFARDCLTYGSVCSAVNLRFLHPNRARQGSIARDDAHAEGRYVVLQDFLRQ
jgi:hypothetical protein